MPNQGQIDPPQLSLVAVTGRLGNEDNWRNMHPQTQNRLGLLTYQVEVQR